MKILEMYEIERGLAKTERLWYTVISIRKGSVFLKKLITAVLAFALAVFTAALISGCGKSDIIKMIFHKIPKRLNNKFTKFRYSNLLLPANPSRILSMFQFSFVNMY